MTSKRETQTAFLLMQDVCGTIPIKDEDSIKDVWKKGVDIGIERANKQVREIAQEKVKANEVCRKASNDIESLQSAGTNRLTEFETELQIAELKCGNLKSQLDYMRFLYQGDKTEPNQPEPAKKDVDKRHREKQLPPPPPQQITAEVDAAPANEPDVLAGPSEERLTSTTFLRQAPVVSRCSLDGDLFAPVGGSMRGSRDKRDSVRGRRRKTEKEERRLPSPDVGGFKVIISPRHKENAEQVKPPSQSRPFSKRRQPSKGYNTLRKEELKSEEVIHDILNGMSRSVFEINELNQAISKDHEKELRRVRREKAERRKRQQEAAGPREEPPQQARRERRKKQPPDDPPTLAEATSPSRERRDLSATLDTSPPRTAVEESCHETPFTASSSRLTVNQIYDPGFQRVYADDNLTRKSVRGQATKPSLARRLNPCSLTSDYPGESEVSVPCSTKRRGRGSVRREDAKKPNKTLGPYTQATRSVKPPSVKSPVVKPPTVKPPAPAVKHPSPAVKHPSPTADVKTPLTRKKKLLKARVRSSKSTLGGRRTATSQPSVPAGSMPHWPAGPAPPLLELYHNAAATADTSPSEVLLSARHTPTDEHEGKQQAHQEAPEKVRQEEKKAAKEKVTEARRERPPTVSSGFRSTKPAPPSEARDTVHTDRTFRRSNRMQPYPLRNSQIGGGGRIGIVCRAVRNSALPPSPRSMTAPSDARSCQPTSCQPMRDERSYQPMAVLGSHRYELPTLSSQLKRTGKSYFSHFNFHNIPFTVGTSTTATHNLGLNMQQCLSIIKLKQSCRGISPVAIAGDLLRESQHTDVMRPISAFLSRMSSKIPLSRGPCPAMRAAGQIEYACGGDSESNRRQLSTHSFQSKIYTNQNILGQPSSNDFVSQRPEDVWAKDSTIYKQPDPKCSCLPERRTVAYTKVLREFVNTKPAGGGSAGAERSKEQEEFFSTLQGRVRGLKQVLMKLQDEFKHLNTKYNAMCEAQDADSSTPADLSDMEAQLQAKENEIQVVLGLFKEVVTLKNQVTHLKSHISATSFTPTVAPSDYRAPRLASDHSTAAVRLTKVLRSIQSFQHSLKAGRLVGGAPSLRN